MTPRTKRLRNIVKHIDGAWVRVYRDGSAWAGAGHIRGEQGMREIAAALSAAGIPHQCKGQPGTAGAFIVDVLDEVEDRA